MITSRTALALAVVAAFTYATAVSAPAAVTVGHSGWEWGNPSPQGQTIQALEFEGASGYAAGWFGTLLSTDDGGTTWRGSATGLTVPLERISLIDTDSVVIGGECAVRRSDDGGQTFTRLPWTATDLRCSAKVAAFDFPTDQVGYLVLDDGSVLSTADGGRTWSRKTAIPVTGGTSHPSKPTDVTFLTPDTGVAVSQPGGIYRTTDGGSSWSHVHAGNSVLSSVHFPSPLVGYVVGTAGAVLRTDDGGLSWTPKPYPGALGLRGIRCATPLACLVTNGSQTVLRTVDGGTTWSSVTAATQKILAAAFSSPTRAVAAGEGGAAVLSDDTGATWRPVGKRLSTTFSRVRALSPSVAFATGPSGALARSDDGGATWSEVGVSTSEDVIDVSFASEATGYALDAAGTLLRTDNSGQSWQILNTGTAARPQAVLALGTQTVLLAGPKGVLRSTDGGNTFTRVRGRLLNRSKLFNVDRGGESVFVYGSKNILVSTTGGRTWQKVRLPRKTLVQAVDFVSPRTGFALGQDGQVYKTRNRGDRWLDLSGVGNDDATGLSFSTGSHGFLTLKRFGSEPFGYVVRTTDGGRTWRPQLVGTDEPSPEGLVATGPGGAFLLADSRALLFTTSGGDRGDPSKVTLRTRRRTVRRRAVIKITGRVSGAKGGAHVVISRRERGERAWVSRTATVASNGTFTTNWKLVKTAAFIAQWAGDENSIGDGSPPLVVRTKRR
jgi:photosystem II stability/assembly factor-like uncharacterized protein